MKTKLVAILYVAVFAWSTTSLKISTEKDAEWHISYAKHLSDTLGQKVLDDFMERTAGNGETDLYQQEAGSGGEWDDDHLKCMLEATATQEHAEWSRKIKQQWCPVATSNVQGNNNWRAPTLVQNDKADISQELADACWCARNKDSLTADQTTSCGMKGSGNIRTLIANWDVIAAANTPRSREQVSDDQRIQENNWYSTINFLNSNPINLSDPAYLDQFNEFFDGIGVASDQEATPYMRGGAEWCKTPGSFMTYHNGQCTPFHVQVCKFAGQGTNFDGGGITQEEVCNGRGKEIGPWFDDKNSCMYLCGYCQDTASIAKIVTQYSPAFEICVKGHISGDSVACTLLTNSVTKATWKFTNTNQVKQVAKTLETLDTVPAFSRLTRSARGPVRSVVARTGQAVRVFGR